MTTRIQPKKLHCSREQLMYNTMTKTYRDGSKQILCASKRIFRAPGWEENQTTRLKQASTAKTKEVDNPEIMQQQAIAAAQDAAEQLELAIELGLSPEEISEIETRKRLKDLANLRRSIRRARVKVRDYALSTDMAWFVTLTLDETKVPSRYDVHQLTKLLNIWLDHQVRRKGLAYVMVPELHQDGAVHYHALFNNTLEAVDSGTIIPRGEDKPRRPGSARQRTAWLRGGGRIVYNLPAWTYGFTTALKLEGNYEQAVNYVCKYISKYLSDDLDQPLPTKIGGRWYYSGGALETPGLEFYNSNLEQVVEDFGAAAHLVKVEDMQDVEMVIIWIDEYGLPRVRS